MIVNLIARLFGLDKGVETVEMGKAYLGGIGGILTGAAAVLGGAAGLIKEIMPLHDVAGYLAFAQGFMQDANVGIITGGALAISAGYAVIGQRHATAKLEANMVKLATDPGPIVIPGPQSLGGAKP